MSSPSSPVSPLSPDSHSSSGGGGGEWMVTAWSPSQRTTIVWHLRARSEKEAHAQGVARAAKANLHDAELHAAPAPAPQPPAKRTPLELTEDPPDGWTAYPNWGRFSGRPLETTRFRKRGAVIDLEADQVKTDTLTPYRDADELADLHQEIANFLRQVKFAHHNKGNG